MDAAPIKAPAPAPATCPVDMPPAAEAAVWAPGLTRSGRPAKPAPDTCREGKVGEGSGDE